MWWISLDTQLSEPTKQNSIKVPKVAKPTKNERYHKILGTFKKPNVSSLPVYNYIKNSFLCNNKEQQQQQQQW